MSGASAGSSPAPFTIPKPHAYALGARDEAHLLGIAAELERKGIPHLIIREPDAPFNGAATAIGCFPTTHNRIRKILYGLPLLGRDE